MTEPETGEQFEAGLKWAPAGENFFLAASVFQIDRENVVTGVFPTFDQLGEVRSRGIELEGQISFDNGLQIGGAATWLDVEIREDSDSTFVGNTPTLIPEFEMALYGSYAFSGTLNGLTTGLGVRHRGESFANTSNTLKVDPSTIVDLFATYEFRDGLVGRLTVTNVADERYVTGCQTEFVCSYGSGREVRVSLTSNF